MPNKIAFVTGSSSGIGQSIVKLLETKGWSVIKPSHKELDLSDLGAVASYAEKIRKDVTKLDAFIHVAGIWHQGDTLLADIPFGSFTTSQIIATINVGVTSAAVLLNSLVPEMSGATVIGISGTFTDGAKGWLPYYLSKRALEDLVVGLSQDNDQLRVFGISPADTATKAYDRFYSEYAAAAQPPELVASLVQKLLNGNSDYKSGDIVQLRNGKDAKAFHV